jgi:hypothetical protein
MVVVIIFVVVKTIFVLYNHICVVFILCSVSFIACVVFVCCVLFECGVLLCVVYYCSITATG